jgi:hypothetical protein
MRQNLSLPVVDFFCFLDREDDDEDVEALLHDKFNSDDENPCCSKIFFNSICNKSISLTLGEYVAVSNFAANCLFSASN